MDRWFCAKILFVPNNGSIENAYRNKYFLKNGIANNAKSQLNKV